jgi:methyl-accepting chemotaxis protein
MMLIARFPPNLHHHQNHSPAQATRGYLPPHNNCFSNLLTDNYEIDLVANRTKRIFDDATVRRCGTCADKMLAQT